MPYSISIRATTNVLAWSLDSAPVPVLQDEPRIVQRYIPLHRPTQGPGPENQLQ